MKTYRNDNRKITEYFKREKLSEKNDCSIYNEIIVNNNTTSKDNFNDISISKNHQDKNNRPFRISEK